MKRNNNDADYNGVCFVNGRLVENKIYEDFSWDVQPQKKESYYKPMGLLGFLSLLLPQKEVTESIQQASDFYWQSQGENSIRMPSTQKFQYSKAAEKQRHENWKIRQLMMDSHLENKEFDYYLRMQYIEPKEINGYNQWSTTEGEELYHALDDLQKVTKHISELKAVPHYYDTRITKEGEIENDTIRRAKKRVADAQKKFNNISEELILTDLNYYSKKKQGDINRAEKQAEKEGSEQLKERNRYNETIRKAGICKATINEKGEHVKGNNKGFESLPDYSLGEKDKERGTEQSNINMKGKAYDPNALQEKTTRGAFRFSFANSTEIGTIPANAETYKEDSMREFESRTQSQDYKTIGDKAVEGFTKWLFG